ncbi:proline-rich receptor-like protein kinase PERK9 [Iris pallida]|uniref:Proline-rich receptor-like protein kinase PERK9 n=1 Tax=Iris pallida TaxID=29817 RepID=A0AAX6GBR0_IRIPA|nr:proline-rich receptor-like protein kinase PERK9 [Iris pallida]
MDFPEESEEDDRERGSARLRIWWGAEGFRGGYGAWPTVAGALRRRKRMGARGSLWRRRLVSGEVCTRLEVANRVRTAGGGRKKRAALEVVYRGRVGGGRLKRWSGAERHDETRRRASEGNFRSDPKRKDEHGAQPG